MGSKEALDLVKQLKHLPGKHPQKSHAGGRGGGSSGGSSGKKKSPFSGEAGALRSVVASIEGAIGEVSEDYDEGMRKSSEVVRGSSNLSGALTGLDAAASSAEKAKKPGDYIDAISMAWSMVDNEKQRGKY